MHKQSYKIADETDGRKIAEFLSKDRQLLLPFLELVCNTEQRGSQPHTTGEELAGS